VLNSQDVLWSIGSVIADLNKLIWSWDYEIIDGDEAVRMCAVKGNIQLEDSQYVR
jgi:hypothetical protein